MGLRSRRAMLAKGLALAAMMLAGAANGAAARETVRIAVEHGLGYAPLFIVAKKPEMLRKYLPDADVELVQLAGGAAVREGLLSGTVDIGGLAMSPIIQAWARGADLKIALAISDMPAKLITYRPDIHSIKDLKPGDKINVVSIGSPLSLMVQMAAESELGNPHALDNSFVTMSHPDGVAAVMTKRDIVATFATPPYIRILMRQPGMHAILTNHDVAAANFSYIVAAAGAGFAHRTAAYDATIHALQDAIAWLNAKPRKAAAFLAAEEHTKLTPADWLAELKQDGVRFAPVPHGLEKLGTFMVEVGVAPKAPRYDQATWPNLHGVGGS